MRECQVCKQCFPDAVTICPEDNQPTFNSIDGNPILEGKYRLEKRLGQGGMGVVYAARHSYLKTQHAIKVILPDLVGNDPQLVTRFRQEALAAAAIRHHNVVQVTDYGVANDTMPFLVMEFVQGESLHDLLAREKRLSPEKAVELMSAICAGVGAAHRQGVIHRDLKPLNVMIIKDAASLSEGVKILDFGLAKIKSGELLGSFIQAQTTGLMGSPYYMSPEQWADDDPDAHADVYSLGIMLYQMLAGDVPFKGSSIPAIMQKHLNTPTPTFASNGVTVPPPVEAAVFHALEKSKDNRTPTVQVLVEELRRALGQSAQSINFTAGLPTPLTSLHIFTTPPQSKIFVDNLQVGETQPDGWFLIEGIQSGGHRLRISKEGFQVWENLIVCDGKPQQLAAKLDPLMANSNPQVNATQDVSQLDATMNVSQGIQYSLSNTQGGQSGLQNTVANVSQGGISQNPNHIWQTGNQSVSIPPPTVKKSAFSPLILAITGILGLLLLTGIGAGVAYKAGVFGVSNTNTNIGNTKTPVSNSNSNTQPTPPVNVKNELIEISGGKFMMGRDDGSPAEQPAHQVDVKDFLMDKTEVTNAEYYEFVKGTGYKAPSYWNGGKPVAEEIMQPVVRVSMEDIKAFAEWRSKRDNAKYRLPTEEEWEYAARNGGEFNLYPWGNNWIDGSAAMLQPSLRD